MPETPATRTTAHPSQAHFVAPLDETPLAATDQVDETAPALSLWGEAWLNLRRRPMFWASSGLIVLVVLVAIAPQLFTHVSPTSCNLENSVAGPRAGHPLGFNLQGCDIYSRVVYGTRSSLLAGLGTTICVVVVGGLFGAVAGFYGKVLDAVLSRIGDIFFAIPLVLGAIVTMQTFRQHRTILTVVATLTIFGWPQLARIMRGAVVSVKNAEFVKASKALGESRSQALLRHVLPNAAAPVIVTATISLGVFIVAEATLSFLGIGLPPTVMSWGNDISQAQTQLRTTPQILFWPSLALSLTVLSFIMLGDVVRDALDPKARKR